MGDSNHFLPLLKLSLMVTMEIVKFVLSYLIESDLDMYYELTDTPAVARSSSLIEELGQVRPDWIPAVRRLLTSAIYHRSNLCFRTRRGP
jgi:hypothetical protein